MIGALTASLGQLCSLRCLRSGLLPDDDAERLLATRARVLSGVWPAQGSWVSLRVERVRDPLFEHSAALLVTESPWQTSYGLSARELNVLNGLAQGTSDQRIASERRSPCDGHHPGRADPGQARTGVTSRAAPRQPAKGCCGSTWPRRGKSRSESVRRDKDPVRCADRTKCRTNPRALGHVPQRIDGR